MSEFPLTPGSITHAAITWLRSDGREEVPTAELAAAVNRSERRLIQHLSPAVRAGLLVRRLKAGYAFWSVGTGKGVQAPNDEEDSRQVLRTSAAAVPSIFAYAAERGAAPFACSTYTDGRMAIERNGRLLLELTNTERLQLLHHAALGHDITQ